MVRTYIVTALLLAASINIGQANELKCAQPGNLEDDACMELAYREADKALNSAYKKLMASLPHPNGPRISHGKTFKETLKLSQQAWLKFRDSNCAFEAFPASDNPSAYMNSTKFCLIRMTHERTNELLKNQ